jgi:hypothetical protein
MRNRSAFSSPRVPFSPLPAFLTLDIRLASFVCCPPRGPHNAAMPRRVAVPCPPVGDARNGVPCGLRFPVPQSRVQSFVHGLHFTLSIGHGFGGIPAPGSFASSAFPFPPKNSSRTASKSFRAPPEMQTLALGADPSRFRVPQLQGQKRRFKQCTRIESN